VSVRVRDLLMRELGALRHEPIDKRIRARLGGATVVDTTRALLVWEPRRVVPQYAVPDEDVAAELRPAGAATDGTGADGMGVPAMGPAPILDGRPVLDPSIPFAHHSAEGEPFVVRGPDGAEAAAFRLAEGLDGYVVLDFDGFDAWLEEDEPNVGHPRDPFHRIEIVRSSRHVTVEAGGELVAESSRPSLLFEPPLPVRYYLPPEDVRLDRLPPSDTRTTCAYKGHARYLSLPGEPDVAWTYPSPLREAAEVTDRIAFFNERVDLRVDGELLGRPVTPWSPR